VTQITLVRPRRCLTLGREQDGGSLDQEKEIALLASIIIALLFACGLANAMRAGRTGKSILRRPYNNLYNDAAGAREDWQG
jgi:hypothetical protein